MLRTVLITTSLAAGLLMLDVAKPTLTGTYAEAAQRGGFSRPAFRPQARVARPAPRMNAVRAKPNFARARSNFGKPKITFRQKAAPKVVRNQGNALKKANIQPKLNPAVKKGFNPSPFQKGPGGIAGAGHHNGLKVGPNFKKPFQGPNVAVKANFLKLANKSWPIHKGPHKIWWKGGWKTFVPFTALSVALIGGAYYYPDAYVSVARPYCGGISPDGCQLNWQEVGFDGGGSEYQCVSYCQRPGQPPPARAAALVMAPPAPSGGRCEVEIFAGPRFAGLNAPSDIDQPMLADAGWKNEIASIQVKAGTWDFFTDGQFTGENMRLPPGPYPDLGPEWTKRIGSFMCVQGG